ncbi:MAG: right-handed parallel beta-helix repeat-containing protein [Phycisphaerales bacterium]|nr:right-handed parallel beta-helix repeat-containing protein [Phycisphaerales bacterium]
MNRTVLLCTSIASLSLVAAALVVAGPLNPPSGSVSSTYKTLTEVEPRIAINSTNTPGDADSLYQISQPGSYYLTANITGVSGRHGIEIASSGVTIDLNGFQVLGVSGSLDGVRTISGYVGISVRNGTVRGWGNSGVDLGLSGGAYSVVADVRAGSNGLYGINVGPGTAVSRCEVWANVGRGIQAGNDCNISECQAYSNGGAIYVGSGCTISECSAYGNAEGGVIAGNGCTISGCSVYQNSGNGINAGNACTITGSTASSNTSNGITANGGNTITGCTSYSNSGDGIATQYGCTISGCTVRSNSLDGIRITGQCRVIGNDSVSNGSGLDGAGIHATSSDNRIEGNNCIGADRGIDVDANGNIIIKNTCSGNASNWDVVANNVCLVVSATNAGAILGNSGGTAPGSTDPSANFTY